MICFKHCCHGNTMLVDFSAFLRVSRFQLPLRYTKHLCVWLSFTHIHRTYHTFYHIHHNKCPNCLDIFFLSVLYPGCYTVLVKDLFCDVFWIVFCWKKNNSCIQYLKVLWRKYFICCLLIIFYTRDQIKQNAKFHVHFVIVLFLQLKF